jgi:glycosyltransferase involved in cell wall biosynthesis
MQSRSCGPSILWWIDHLGSGGSQQVLVRLIEHMAVSAKCQRVICLRDVVDPDLKARINSVGAELHMIGKKKLLCGIGFYTLQQLIRRGRFDVSVTFLFVSDIIGTLMACLGHIPGRISAQRSSNRNFSLVRRKLIQVALMKSTRIVLNSSAYRSYMERILPRRVPVCVIPNGVDINRFSAPGGKQLIHEELGLPSSVLLLGCIGRLSVEKRLADVIEALSLLKDKNTHLILVGDGPEFQRLVDAVSRFGLLSRVHFLGPRRNIPEILSSISVYIQASSFEGMPNGLLEAMAVGCPVAVSEIGENMLLVDNGNLGWTFEVGDARGLARNLDKLLEDQNSARLKAVGAKEKIVRYYREELMLTAWENLLIQAKEEISS